MLTNDPNWRNGIGVIREPARTILAGDVVGTSLDPNARNAFQVLNPPGYGSSSPTDMAYMATRHSGGSRANIVFYDGHVETVDRDKYHWPTLGGFTTSAPENPWKPW